MQSLQEQLAALQSRADGLEAIFGHYMLHTGASFIELNRTLAQIEKQTAQDRKEFTQRLAEIEEKAAQDRKEFTQRFAEIEEKAAQSNEKWNQRFAEMEEKAEQERKRDHEKWNQRFAEIEEKAEQERQRDREQWNQRFAQMREEAEQERKRDRREWNKRWGDLANRLGTLVEDIVAPNMPRVARDYFGVKSIEDLMVRRWIRNKKDRGKRREFDAIVVGDDKVIINETKADARIKHIDSFIDALGEIEDYFPEYKGKTIIPLFASLYISEDVINYLTKNKIYAMAMGEETMSVVNYAQVTSRMAAP